MQVTTSLKTIEPHRVYRMDNLVEITGFSRRQIKRMIERGVLPKCHGRGPAGYYTDQHLNRLMKIRREREQRRTYEDFIEYFADISA